MKAKQIFLIIVAVLALIGGLVHIFQPLGTNLLNLFGSWANWAQGLAGIAGAWIAGEKLLKLIK